MTKELQEILNARARGDYIEKGFGNLEKEIQAVNVVREFSLRFFFFLKKNVLFYSLKAVSTG